MTDCFEIFHEPHRPWLDAESLKEKFHRLTATHHPDVARGAEVDFSALNAAYQTLRDPKTRLRHLLELEFPEKLAARRQVPGDIGELFSFVGQYRAGMDAFLARLTEANTPLERALLASAKNEHCETSEKTLAILVQKQEGIFMQLQFIDSVWDDDKAASADALPDICQSISFVAKWIGQVREDILKLEQSSFYGSS